MIAFESTGSFFTVDIGNVATLAGVGLGLWRFGAYSAKARREILTKQVQMHEENKNRFERLSQFEEDQRELNRKRDTQVSELTAQTREMVQIAKGFDRRLEMLEERRRRERP